MVVFSLERARVRASRLLHNANVDLHDVHSFLSSRCFNTVHAISRQGWQPECPCLWVHAHSRPRPLPTHHWHTRRAGVDNLGRYSCAAVSKAPQQLHPGACDRRLRGRTMHAEVPCPRRDAYLPPYAWAWLWQPQLHGRLASPHTRADFRDCGETILSCVACVCCSPSLVEARANMHTGRLERRGRPQLAAFACLETVLDPRRLRCFHWICDILEHMQVLR